MQFTFFLHKGLISSGRLNIFQLLDTIHSDMKGEMHGGYQMADMKIEWGGEAGETSLIIDVYHGACKHTTHRVVFIAVHHQ